LIDPLSGYLNICGYENTLSQMPAEENCPLILVMTFKDGTDEFIPAGSDLPFRRVNRLVMASNNNKMTQEQLKIEAKNIYYSYVKNPNYLKEFDDTD